MENNKFIISLLLTGLALMSFLKSFGQSEYPKTKICGTVFTYVYGQDSSIVDTFFISNAVVKFYKYNSTENKISILTDSSGHYSFEVEQWEWLSGRLIIEKKEFKSKDVKLPGQLDPLGEIHNEIVLYKQ